MKNTISFIALLFFLSACSEKKAQTKNDFIIAHGQMPAIAKDEHNNLHVVFGSGDSVMYTYSKDKGNTFSIPALIAKLPHVYAYAMRGPQIAVTDKEVIVTACTTEGNIYSFHKEIDGSWKQGSRINDVDTIAKEGLMALSADGNNVFAVWLDLRGNKRNKIVGSKSTDGGKTWSKNILIYKSPDSTVCECCKPSVAMQGSNFYVMFRNWLNGNRDLYLIQSADGGNSFGEAQKLGMGNWQLNGCPMDGGGLAIAENGVAQTVWRRQSKIYAAVPGTTEKEIGEGKGYNIETINGKNIYAWTNTDGNIVCLLPDGGEKILGKGILPNLKSITNDQVICVWQNDDKIMSALLII